MSSLLLLSLSFLPTIFSSPLPQEQQQIPTTSPRTQPGSITCSEICGGPYICTRLDPTAPICARPFEAYIQSYNSCLCSGLPSSPGIMPKPQLYSSWPPRPKLPLQPSHSFCASDICSDVAMMVCTPEPQHRNGVSIRESPMIAFCQEQKARHEKDRVSCQCKPGVTAYVPQGRIVAERKKRATPLDNIAFVGPVDVKRPGEQKKPEVWILPYPMPAPVPAAEKKNEAHILPYPLPKPATENKPSEAHILPYPLPVAAAPVPTPAKKGEAHILPYPLPATEKKKGEVHILPYPYPIVAKEDAKDAHTLPV